MRAPLAGNEAGTSTVFDAAVRVAGLAEQRCDRTAAPGPPTDPLTDGRTDGRTQRERCGREGLGAGAGRTAGLQWPAQGGAEYRAVGRRPTAAGQRGGHHSKLWTWPPDGSERAVRRVRSELRLLTSVWMCVFCVMLRA